MQLDDIIATGLSPQQAMAYSQLIEYGELRPPALAEKMKTTRTNAYKILDKLVELGLAVKDNTAKINTYQIANPMAFASLAADYRAEATAREEAVKSVLDTLLDKYYKHSTSPYIKTATGRAEVASAYRKQLALGEDIHFIHTKSDVALMGFDVMHDIRITPARYGKKRDSIMFVDGKKNPTLNQDQHTRSNMDVAWSDENSYTAPVEWSVTESSLLIVLYATEPHAILIVDKVVASAFLQLYMVLHCLVKRQPTHQQLAKREE